MNRQEANKIIFKSWISLDKCFEYTWIISKLKNKETIKDYVEDVMEKNYLILIN